MAAYIMVRGKPVAITEILSVESRYFEVCLAMEFDGEVPVKIKSRCLEKALYFCKERPNNLRKVEEFDIFFLGLVRESGLDLVDLIYAAGRLGIFNLLNLLFEDVVDIICSKTPEQVEKIFKIRYYSVDWLFPSIKDVLDFAPPCPNLSQDEQQEMKDNLIDILKVSPADFQTLPPPRKRYWIYAHLLMKCNPDSFITTHSKEDVAEEDDEEEEEYA